MKQFKDFYNGELSEFKVISKAQRKKMSKELEESKNILNDFGLGDGDIDDIFDIIAEEHPEI